MRFAGLLYLLFCVPVWAQVSFEAKMASEYRKCPSKKCRLETSFSLAEYYMESDQIAKSQQWLEITKELNRVNARDTMSYYIQSLQSELFYYMGLFQFGVQEAQKALTVAKIQNDSMLIADAYLFVGINHFEMNQLSRAEAALYNAKRYFPKSSRKRLRFLVRNEHIYNNIAQLKLAQNQLDSAGWYIKEAHRFAVSLNSARGIPNTLQTKGRIFLERKQTDSARFYLRESNRSAIESGFSDILLINHGYLMEVTRDKSRLDSLYLASEEIIERKKVNLAFQRLFYTSAVKAFAAVGDFRSVLSMQEKIITIDAQTRLNGNLYIQNISNQYVRNESKLLSLKIQELNRQRNLVMLELLAALLCVAVLVLVLLFIRRKNRIQQVLLDQKNEISKDLHDDIGSGLSSILIHADLLRKTDPQSDKHQLLASKIDATGKEVSQRLNTFIWSLNNENNSVQNFCEYVKFYADRLLEGTSVGLDFSENIPDPAQTLNGHARKNLFFCIKEILNNSLKHAKASNIKLHISADKKQLSITISDDGIGMVRENAFGNGLKNIQKRIDALDGRLALTNVSGLEIKIEIPA